MESLWIKTRTEFLDALANGTKRSNSYLQVYILQSDAKRFGFIISKKVGNAVVRNRLRRQLREIIRKWLDTIPTSSVIIRAKSSITELTFQDIQKQLLALLIDVSEG